MENMPGKLKRSAFRSEKHCGQHVSRLLMCFSFSMFNSDLPWVHKSRSFLGHRDVGGTSINKRLFLRLICPNEIILKIIF